MKIGIIDSRGCKNGNFGFQIESEFKNLGWDTFSINYRMHNLQKFNITNNILNKFIIKKIIKENPDLLLVNKGESIVPKTIQKIKKEGISVFNWTSDEPFGYLDKINKINNIDEYDAFFTYDKQYLNDLKEINPNTYYLPAGAQPFGVHKERIPLNERKYKWDMCLVGTAYKNRVKLLKKYTNRKLLLAGPGWNKFSKKSLPFVSIYEMSKLHNMSKVILNIYGPSKYFIVPNPRTFEIPASKSFQLTNMKRDINSFFKINKEIAIYNDENEFKELVQYYCENENERIKIIKNSYKRVLNEHTMLHRIKNLISVYKKIK